MASDYRDPTTWRQKTVGNIPYRTVSHEGTMTFEKVDATEEYLVAASDLQAFIRELFPLPVIKNGIPLYQYRPMPGSLRITASSVSWKSHDQGLPVDPWGADPNAPNGTYYPVCLVTVRYDDEVTKPDGNEENPDENDPKTFLEISANSAGDFIHSPIPNSSWEQTTGTSEPTSNTTPNAPVQLIVPETEWTLNWPRVSNQFFEDILITRLRDAMGKVNSDIYPLLYNAAAETLLFVGWTMSEERQFLFNDETNQVQFLRPPLKVSVKMLEKQVEYIVGSTTHIAGHNHVWRPGYGWRRLLFDGVTPLHQSHNFNNIFAPVGP